MTRFLTSLTLLLATPALAQLEPQPRPDDEAVPPAPLPPPELESPPELIAGADPISPPEAQAAGRGGDVVLRIVIDDEGLVERLDVVQSAGVDLDWAALGAATNFVFAPAMFCVYARPADPGAPPDAAPEKRCGTPGKVAIDYKPSFQVTEQKVEVPVEPVDERTLVEGMVNFEGVVREAATKDPLEAVEVTVEIERPGVAADAPVEERYDLRTTTTDEAGRFSYRGIPAGSHRVTFTLSGYEAAFVDEDFQEKERTELVVYLRPLDANKFETVVRRRRAQKDVAKVALTRDEVRRVPGTFGDPLRVIENLPGLARAPFVGGALIVRGANPEDTGVYFDGVEIPLLYHFGGLTSVVNAEFLEDISFYPGGFGAYYGRATAGIVDVASRKLKLKGFRGYAELDLIDSGFFFAGPVQVGELPKVTFAAAARRSYIDGILPVILDAFIGPDGQGIVAAPIYWDYQTKMETSPSDGHNLSLFLFGSDDDLSVIQRGLGNTGGLDIGFHTTFHRLVGNWEWRLAPGLTHSFAPFAGLTRVSFDAGNNGDQGPQVGLSAVIDTWQWGARDDLTLVVDDLVTVRGGLDYLGQTFGVEFDVPLPIEIGSFPRVFPRIEGSNQTFGSHGMGNAAGVWLEAELSPVPGLKVVPGVRAEYTLVSFFPDKLADGSLSESADVALFHIDPRVTARLELLKGTTLKGAAGIYRQAPSGPQLSPDGGNPELLEPRAVQLISGVEQRLTRDIHVDAQLYYTNRDLLVQSSGRTRARDDGSGEVDPLFYDNGGRGNTVGAELLLRHEITEHFYGWVAYTLSRTVEDLDDNSDRWWLTDYDQTHILTVVAQTNLPWAFTLGARFRIVSGSPTNVPLGSVHDLDTTNYNGLGSTPQSSRLPTFHQLDLRIDRKFVFDTFSFTAYLDLLNVYNQENAEGFISDFRSREQEPIPSLPILPVIGLSGEF
ncbi:MAG: TonB family protein [Deltaproteobacteria bacterium]|nr:TonB family protein [Deltaproteobacteria bacterium]